MKKIYALIPALFLAVAACSSTPETVATSAKTACEQCTECKAGCKCTEAKTKADKKSCMQKCECKTCPECKADRKAHKGEKKSCGCDKAKTAAPTK